MACLVACDFTYAYIIDCTKAFSLGIQLNSIHVLLSLVINGAWSLHQLGVSNSFLYGELEKKFSWRTSKICFLEGVIKGVSFASSIYGLKKSPHAWVTKFSGHLMMFGLLSCAIDLIIFTKKIEEGIVIFFYLCG